MKCGNCKYWGDGNGTGMSFDAGHMNYCKQPQINGMQHPSYGAMVYTGWGGDQDIMTSIIFGCILFEQRSK
jgi:hypothetical protein